ncbi:MGMT family protein [Bacillus sp. Marseille-Q3570]|uniref:MGMT family protein n=1 Tax=Bacillus sp. Marseille-Q3570 TaxID=2963522 RepID=UPI0021B734FC|nr:MGMT family protein [Bacillus sp. Marseille-Q3570]
MQPFTQKVISIIQDIPSGKVMTYGQIARLAGNPRGARQVVRILHTMSQAYKLPWHRVINAKGEIAIKDGQQRSRQLNLLNQEGIKLFNQNKVDLSEYRYDPDWNDVDII